jgi:hypothetical protein
VLAHADTVGERIVDQVRDLPLGPARDRRAVEVLVDVALAHPGMVALMLAPATRLGADAGDPGSSPSASALQAFGVDPDTTDAQRLVRVLGALAALAVLTLAAHNENQTTAWRQHIVATCFDALGHGRPGADHPHSDEVEA